jgi:rubredoxin
MVSAGVVAALEQNVFRRNHFVRDNAIYTLAKLGSVASVPALHRAFSRYRDSDPILLPNLVFELRWLGKKMWPLVEEMLSASHFSTRWATIRFLAEGCWPSHADDFDRYKASLQSLANESNALLVAEASYELKKLTCYNETRIVEKYEKRKLRKQVRKLQPATTFEQIRISFRNHLCRTGKEDYDITELERFISDTSS